MYTTYGNLSLINHSNLKKITFNKKTTFFSFCHAFAKKNIKSHRRILVIASLMFWKNCRIRKIVDHILEDCAKNGHWFSNVMYIFGSTKYSLILTVFITFNPPKCSLESMLSYVFFTYVVNMLLAMSKSWRVIFGK